MLPCVLVVADPERIAELVSALAEPLLTEISGGHINLLVSSGGDDTIDLFAARKPHVVIVTATLAAGDAPALVETLRGMVPRTEVAVVVIGDGDKGTIRNVADANELAPDRFVTSPISPNALRFAVASGIEAVAAVRGVVPMPHATSPGIVATPRTPAPLPVVDEPSSKQRAALRARWAALADSIIDVSDDIGEEEHHDEPAPLPPPIMIRPRANTAPHMDAVAAHDAWRPGTTSDLQDRPWSEPPAEAPTREPTLILRDEPDPPEQSRSISNDPMPVGARTRTGDGSVVMTERALTAEHWSTPLPLAALTDRDSRPRGIEADRRETDDLGLALDEFDDELVMNQGSERHAEGRLEGLDDLPDATPPPDESTPEPVGDGRDFARQLRAKMSMMAQRLFQGGEAGGVLASPADLAPRHDHHTHIDLAALGEDLPLGGGVTEIESRSAGISRASLDHTTSPGSWDTQAGVRERGLPDSGEIVRGVSDAAMLLAKMFVTSATGRVGFRRDEIETVVFFDQGRPVFASSSEPRDRMGGLLVREGKITASQYERCQTMVSESGRRIGEILVDLGYLKRRELLPAVRRHVEDIVYSLFGWDRGHYRITVDTEPSAERIRLSRHPASLILEGIRRKLDRTTLERLIGPPSTVIEVADRERLGGIVNMGDLAAEERAALAAFDGQADLATVSRAGGIDVADLLPLAWGLCVLGLATARRTDTEIPDESTALVGETDLAIDRERVRARWQLVTDADYFALLGVRRDATAFEIRRAYQSARRDFAADCFPADLRRELAQELDDIANVLDEAFRVLRDDRLRVTYLSNLIE
ncbi:MAG: DUF4388 domain-containing protein [Deltaproteobacteria bacterium]|nr:DUF4388 domain-containing protein [Deltaproteobacteria bacterium]